MSRMGLDLKQKLTDYIRSTWRTISDFAYAHKSSDQEVDSEVDSVMSQMAADSNIDDTACGYSMHAYCSVLPTFLLLIL